MAWRLAALRYFWFALAPGGVEYELWGRLGFWLRCWHCARLFVSPHGYWSRE